MLKWNVVKAAQVMNHVLKEAGYDSRVYDGFMVNVRGVGYENPQLLHTIHNAPFTAPFVVRPNPAFWQIQFGGKHKKPRSIWSRDAGTLIAVEGIDGVGKSTICKEIEAIIHDRYACHPIVQTSALSDNATELGRAIGMMLFGYDYNPSSITESLLILAARRDNLENVIIPGLARGYWIISDRHVDSLSVYQHRHDDHGLKTRMLMEQYELTMPADITFVLDLPPDHPRLKSVGGNRLEDKPVDFWKYAREKFLDIAAISATHEVIDARLTIPTIKCIIKKHLEDHFFGKRNQTNDQT